MKKYLLEGKFKTLDKLNSSFNEVTDKVADKTADAIINKIPWYWIGLVGSLIFALAINGWVGIAFAILFLYLSLKN